MKKKEDTRIFKIDPSLAPSGFKSEMLCRMFGRAIGLHKLDQVIFDGRKHRDVESGNHFSDDILRGMGVNVEITDEDRARIPKEGPVIVVANHPFGGIEGVALLSILNSVRPDSKAMANYILHLIPEMREMFIPVNPFGSEHARKQNTRPLLDTMRWIKDGHVLGVFPSGEVSSIDLKNGRVRDPMWSASIASIARKTNATVVPLFFEGRNPAYFQIAGLIHPRLRTAMLPTMTSNKYNKTIKAHVGAPISPSEMKRFETDEELIKYFRVRTYALEGRQEKLSKYKRLVHRRKAKQSKIIQQDIIDETPVAQIEAAIAKFAPEAKMLSSGDITVYMTQLAEDSPVMREIGRLREITFRQVGEGTGRSIDVDVFDVQYHHLFLWNTKAHEIVGAYRLGLADKICERYGVKGLYTHTLFKFNDKLMDAFQPSIELGRSFVRPEYQRSFSPLLLLWKGIGAFIARNPQYANLFGPVSITADYRDSSRNMLLRSLRLSNFANDLSRLVKPRKAARDKNRKAEWVNPDYERIIGDIDEVSRLIQDIEKDHKGIPILIKQYLKLGGKILEFNVDPDFSDVVDGLILIDLRQTDARTRVRYMGDEAAKSFCEYHKL